MSNLNAFMTSMPPSRHFPLSSQPPRRSFPEDARRLVEGYVRHYNEVRLHGAIGSVTPAAMLAGRPSDPGEAIAPITPRRYDG